MIRLSLFGVLALLSCGRGLKPAHPCAATRDQARAASRPTSRPAVAPHPTTLIRGATVWTAAGEIIEGADVLLRDGRISAVGKNLEAAASLQIDGRGKHLTPGLIDPHSHLGVYPSPYLQALQDGNEIGDPFSAEVRAADALWPQDPGFSHALAAGVTTALILPGSANLVGGRGIVVKLLPGRSAEQMRFVEAPPALKMACGENPKRIYGKKGGPNTRMGSVARLRAAFQQAREYRRTWRRYRDKREKWEEKQKKRCGKRPAGDADNKEGGEPPDPPKRDLALETLVGVLEGRVRAHWHCYRADEMLNLLALAREQGFRIQAFHHAVETYKIRDALARAGTAAVTWVNWWGFKIEAYDTIPENAALVATAGGLAALHSDSPMVIQRLNQEAALAYHHARRMGLRFDRDAAIRLVTRNPAKIIGVADQTGSIEVGKMADLVLWDGDPFSVYSRSEKVFVDGSLVYDRTAPDKQRRPSDFEVELVPRPPALGGSAAPSSPPALPRDWPAVSPRPLRPAPGKAERIAIVNARVETMVSPAIEKATIIIEGGRIVAVGPRLAVPTGARVIEAAGRTVTPGLIAAESTLGLVDISAEPMARDHRVKANNLPVRASLRIWDALNPANPAIPVARLAGFTSAVVRPLGGLIGGQGAAFDLDGRTRTEIGLVAPVALYANLGLAGAEEVGSRALALMRLRRLLADARRLKQKRSAVESRRYRDLVAPLAELEALIPVVERRQPLVVYVERASDILAVLELARQQRIHVALTGAAEAWRVADAIAEARVPVIVAVDNNLPATFDTLGARLDNAARLHQAGVAVAISAEGTAHSVSELRQLAGIAVAWGLPHDAALAALTRVPARIFGLRDRGVIEPGARANIVVWSGDPLELGTHVEQLLIAGRSIPLHSRQTVLRERYRTLR